MLTNKTRSYKYSLPAILWAILIFTLSSVPSYSIPSFALNIKDLVLHFIEYSIFGFLLIRAFIQSQHKANWKYYSLALLIGILYAVSDEFHQKFVEGRYSEFSDILADSAGIIFGVAIFISHKKYSFALLNRRKSKQ